MAAFHRMLRDPEASVERIEQIPPPPWWSSRLGQPRNTKTLIARAGAPETWPSILWEYSRRFMTGPTPKSSVPTIKRRSCSICLSPLDDFTVQQMHSNCQQDCGSCSSKACFACFAVNIVEFDHHTSSRYAEVSQHSSPSNLVH